MKAVRINEFGGLEVLQWEDVPEPDPAGRAGIDKGGFCPGSTTPTLCGDKEIIPVRICRRLWVWKPPGR